MSLTLINAILCVPAFLIYFGIVVCVLSHKGEKRIEEWHEQDGK